MHEIDHHSHLSVYSFPRCQASALMQLRLGHAPLNHYLVRIGEPLAAVRPWNPPTTFYLCARRTRRHSGSLGTRSGHIG